MTLGDAYELRVLGYVRSPVADLADAPKQGDEGAPTRCWTWIHRWGRH